jgi:hypothetical protein
MQDIKAKFYMKKSDIKNSADMFLYKAIIDFNSGKALYTLFENDEIDIDIEKIYFDFQQSVEKLLKSLLTHSKVEIEKTHDINKLFKLCKNNNILLLEEMNILIDLTDYAVEGRYGIICDDINDTENYIDKILLLIKFTRQQLL